MVEEPEPTFLRSGHLDETVVQPTVDNIPSENHVREREHFDEHRIVNQFSHQADPPRCLPMRPGRVFFSVDMKASSDQWDAVQRSLSLAVRFNENLIAGDVQNRTAIDVMIDGRPSTLEFVLYVVPPSAV